MARKRKAAKKTVRKARRSPRKKARKPSRPKKSAARTRKPASKKIAKKPTPKKSSSRRGLPDREPSFARKAAASRVGADESSSGRSVFSPDGVVYGDGGWKEEELSAAELDVDAPEIDEIQEELDGPEIAGESDDTDW